MFKNMTWDNTNNIQRDMCLLRATIYIGWVDRQTFLKRFLLCWYLSGRNSYLHEDLGKEHSRQQEELAQGLEEWRNLVHSRDKEVSVAGAKLLLSCLTLWDPMDYSPPGSSVHGMLQARILEWVAMPSSKWSSQPRDWTRVSYTSCIARQVLYF